MTEENKITEEEQMQITMGLIINAGNAKAFAVEHAPKTATLKVPRPN